MKLAIVALAFAGLALGGWAWGLEWNGTPSMPIGVYRVTRVHGGVHRGDVVSLCLPPRAAAEGLDRGYLGGGDCPGNAERLIKTVVAVSGDRVEVSDQGVMVNGALIPGTAPLPNDDAGRPMQAAFGVYTATGPWVIGVGDPRSYDSRYYGEVSDIRDHANLFVSF